MDGSLEVPALLSFEDLQHAVHRSAWRKSPHALFSRCLDGATCERLRAPSTVRASHMADLTLTLGHFALWIGVPADFVMHQTATTLSFRPVAVGRLFTCGTEYQIEHHLFPDISHVRGREMSPLLRAFRTQYGYPYRTQSWWQGVRGALAAFRNPCRTSAAPRARSAGA